MISKEIKNVREKVFPSIFSAISISFLRRHLPIKIAPPVPTIEPIAVRSTISGKVNDSPANAVIPSLSPINHLSEILQKAATIILIAAGTE